MTSTVMHFRLFVQQLQKHEIGSMRRYHLLIQFKKYSYHSGFLSQPQCSKYLFKWTGEFSSFIPFPSHLPETMNVSYITNDYWRTGYWYKITEEQITVREFTLFTWKLKLIHQRLNGSLNIRTWYLYWRLFLYITRSKQVRKMIAETLKK